MINFIKKYKYIILAAVIIIAALTFAFLSGGNVSETKKLIENTQQTTIAETTETKPVPAEKKEAQPTTEKKEAETVQETTARQTSHPQTTTAPSKKTESVTKAVKQSSQTSKTVEKQTQPATQDKYKTDPVPANKPKPVEPQEQEVKPVKKSCTFSISCKTILDNMDLLDEDKTELVPADGWILKPVEIEFNEGENLFELTKRVCQDKNIHFSFVNNPIYNSAYIEDFGNLYEFDCGGNSGWMISVNDWFLNYGVSRYVIQDGDVVKWQYTCNLGYDIGGGYLQEEQNE